MLKITLVRSVIGAKPVNRRTIKALGLRKTGRTVYREDVPSIRGMLRNVQHLLKVETVDSAPAKVAKPKKVKTQAAPKPVVTQVKVKDKPAVKKPAVKKPAPKKPAARKPDTDRKSFGQIGKDKKTTKKKES